MLKKAEDLIKKKNNLEAALYRKQLLREAHPNQEYRTKLLIIDKKIKKRL